MNITRLIFCLLAGTFIAQSLWYYPNLPETIAIHYNVYGQPDNWTTKSNYLIFEALVLIFIVAETFLLPRILERLPDSMFNLPDRDFWLAPERSAETFAVMRSFFESLGIALLALFLGINQLVVRANLKQENLSAESWWILGAFMIFLVLWMIKLHRRFKIKNV